jgi:hypothetical protein
MSFKPPSKLFGGIPQMSIPPQMSNPMPMVGSTGDEDEEIRLLTEQLQFELGNLSGTHSTLEQDMQRLAAMLAPYMTPAGRLNLPDNGHLDPKILLFKQGLDFRIAEYNEDCKRLEQVQSRLQRKLEEAAGSYERTFMGVSGLADARIIRRLEELQRTIQVQQQELDQARFEKDVVADEAKRLKQLFIRTGPTKMLPGGQPMMKQEPYSAGVGSLHTATAAKFAPMAGPSTLNSAKVPSFTQASAPSVTNAYPPAVQTAPVVQQANNPAPAQSQSWTSWITGTPEPAAVAPGISMAAPVARRDFL